MATSLIGQQLGKYNVVDLIGRGGMATVYKGYQPEIERSVAIKVLPPHPGQDSSYVERFRQEARTIARLQHPHIMPLYDYGDENGILYLVSPLMEGGSLSDRIRKGPLSLDETAVMLRQIGSALDYAHRHGVIHRDIKPDNVLLDREGHALLTDFGIAKIVEGTANLTATGGVIGTPAYMSPEQAQGLAVDYRSDLYSLGVVVFEMLTGKEPFDADTPMRVVMQHITAPVPHLSESVINAAPQLDEVLLQALAKEPERRFQSAIEFIDAFNRAVQGHEPLIVPTGQRRAAAPTISPTVGDPLPALATSRLRDTMAVSPTTNPLILLGGFTVIAVLIVVVLLILTNRSPAPGVTEATLSIEATTAPTQVAAAVTSVPAVPVFGRASFSASAAPGDTINLRVEGVSPAPIGSSYTAWLVNTDDDTVLRVGDLRTDALGSGQLSYTDDSGAMLFALYNAVALTLEEGQTDAPQGAIVYSGSVPREITQALNALLVDTSIPAGDKPAYSGSLYDGALNEATIGRQHSGLAAGATTVGGMHTHAEHTINILNGTQEDYDGDGRGSNPGRGYGVRFFLDHIVQDLDAAVSADGTSRSLQSQIELIRVCINNANNWTDQIVELESQVVASDSLESVQPQLVESTELAAALIEGVDLNGNGQVDPFEGECGLEQISVYGTSVSNMDIVAGPLTTSNP